MWSSTMTTRLAAGVPLSERQRAQRASPLSVQRMTGYVLMIELGTPRSECYACREATVGHFHAR
jgi:hypothetical protein